MRWYAAGTLRTAQICLAESQVFNRESARYKTAVRIQLDCPSVSLDYSGKFLARLLLQRVQEDEPPGWKVLRDDAARADSIMRELGVLMQSSSLRISQMSIRYHGVTISCDRRLAVSKVNDLIDFALEAAQTITRLTQGHALSITDSR
jgi:hypothetical protein